MRGLILTFKAIGYMIAIAICSPLLWWLGRADKPYEGELYMDFDDDNDPGEDIDQ